MFLAGRRKGSEKVFPERKPPPSLHESSCLIFNKCKGRGGQRKESLARDRPRVTHGRDGKMRREVKPDTTLPLTSGAKLCDCTASLSRGLGVQGHLLTNVPDCHTYYPS